MIDRIKLTEDDFTDISDYDCSWIHDGTLVISGNHEQLKQQILGDNKKIEDYNKMISVIEKVRKNEPITNHLAIGIILDENKKLKEENDNLGSELQEAWHLVKVHKQKVEKIERLVDNCIYHVLPLDPKQIKEILEKK